MYWEFHERGFQQAVRMGDWKAVRLARDQPLELYNLATDRAEKTNVASKEPAIVERIEKVPRDGTHRVARLAGEIAVSGQRSAVSCQIDHR